MNRPATSRLINCAHHNVPRTDSDHVEALATYSIEESSSAAETQDICAGAARIELAVMFLSPLELTSRVFGLNEPRILPATLVEALCGVGPGVGAWRYARSRRGKGALLPTTNRRDVLP
jgi:hypothetical protein